MIIHYSSKKDKKILESERLIRIHYGKASTNLINRLSELRAANSLQEIPQVPPPRRHKLKGDKKDCWGIDYTKNHRIIVQPCGIYDINDLRSIKEIKIVGLEDYH